MTGECRDTLQGHRSAVTCLALAADGQLLVSGSKDSTIRTWPLIRTKEFRVGLRAGVGYALPGFVQRY